MGSIKEVQHLRELLEKDITYIKEKVDKIESYLTTLNSQVTENTEFRKKFKWTTTLIVSLSSIITFLISLFIFRN